MDASPIVLVPGFWLGSWAWDEVAELLRDERHDVSAITLPGLQWPDTDRSTITLDRHIQAICDAVAVAAQPAVLVVHSGAGLAGYAATDHMPERIAAMVYVDSAPATTALDPDFDGVELPLPPRTELAADENLDGLSAEQLDTFYRRAVPEPGDVLRQAPRLTNEARFDVPSVAICTGMSSDDYRGAVAAGQGWAGGFAELHDVRWVDLPTSHWPMWSRPKELAAIISSIANGKLPD